MLRFRRVGDARPLETPSEASSSLIERFGVGSGASDGSDGSDGSDAPPVLHTAGSDMTTLDVFPATPREIASNAMPSEMTIVIKLIGKTITVA